MNEIEKKLEILKELKNKLSILLSPLLGIIISGTFLFLFVYILFIGQINLNNLADSNGTVRIPIIFIIILIPLGYLVDFFGETIGISIIIGILLLIFIFSCIKLLKRIKIIKK